MDRDHQGKEAAAMEEYRHSEQKEETVEKQPRRVHSGLCATVGKKVLSRDIRIKDDVRLK